MFLCVLITCDVFIEDRSSYFKVLIEKLAAWSQRKLVTGWILGKNIIKNVPPINHKERHDRTLSQISKCGVYCRIPSMPWAELFLILTSMQVIVLFLVFENKKTFMEVKETSWALMLSSLWQFTKKNNRWSLNIE